MRATFTPDTTELREISRLPTESALRRTAAFLADLVKDPAFMDSQVFPVLEEAKESKGWYVARRHDDDDGTFSLQIFVWPQGTGTRIHDHTSWGAFCCASGTVLEERYARLDDGSRPDHAHLEKIWQLWWGPEDGASTVQPGDKGIHRVGNPRDGTAVTVHLYGPRTGNVDGRDYDPSCDRVCDRLTT